MTARIIGLVSVLFVLAGTAFAQGKANLAVTSITADLREPKSAEVGENKIVRGADILLVDMKTGRIIVSDPDPLKRKDEDVMTHWFSNLVPGEYVVNTEKIGYKLSLDRIIVGDSSGCVSQTLDLFVA